MAHYNYNCDLRSLVDSTGVRTDLRPELSYGENAIWEFEIFEGDHIPSDLSGLTAFRAAMDTDFSSKTEVMVRVLPENITLDGNVIRVELDATASSFLEKVDGREKTAAWFELSGLTAAGSREFYLILPVYARMTLDPESEITALPLPETVADRAWVLALLRAGFEVDFRETSDGGTEFRLRSASAGGEWSDYVTLPRGEPGPAGADGVGSYLYVAYASDASGSGFSLTPSNDRKFRAEIHRTSELSSPSASDFAGAVWVKYLGDDGAGAGDMLKTVYDTDNDGVVDHAASADAVGETGAAAVSDAVQKSHTHTNSATLAKFGESNGRPTFSGAEIAGASSWEELTGKPESFPAASHTHALSEVNGLESALSGKLDASQRGAAGGVAELGSDGKVPLSQLPSGIGSGSGGSGQTLLHIPVPVDADNDALHLIVEFSSDAVFSTVAATLDTRTNRDGVYYFLGGQVGKYQPFPSDGVGLEAYRSDVLIDLAAAGIANTSFRRYRWHDGTVYTDWRGL